MKNNPIIDQQTYDLLDQYMLARLQGRLDKTDKKMDLGEEFEFGEDSVCVICFDDLSKEDITKCR